MCYLRTDSSVHAVGGWGRHFGKDVYERYLLPSNFATLNPRRYGNGTFTSGVYYTLLMAVRLWAMVVYKLHGVG